MNAHPTGITIAGNILTDLVKDIDHYPAIGMLANISHISRAVGGCVPNTGINLAKMAPDMPLSAVGCIGRDEQGEYVLAQLQNHGIDTTQVTVLDNAPTGFSDVMNLPSGERTFFHARGANARFAPHHVDIAALNSRMLHIGYILLLDEFDRPDPDYGTAMARFLHDVQEAGIKTSVDVVSDSSADFPGMVSPALGYCNYAIMNEIESCAVSGLSPRTSDGRPDVGNIRRAMEEMAAKGVKDKVIVHSKEAGFCLDVASGRFTAVPSLNIPADEIKGSVGAGDAYCAGCLYGLYNDLADEDLLRFASAAAACNLFAANSIDGMQSVAAIQKMENHYGRVAECW